MTLEELRSDTHFLLNTTSGEYPNTDLDRAINRWYHKVQGMIIDWMDSWIFHGDWAYGALAKDQEEYIFPSDILNIKRAEIRYSDGINDWVKLTPVDLQAIRGALSDSFSAYSKAYPVYAKPDELSLVIRPIPDIDVEEGLRIWYTKAVSDLTSNDDYPVFVETFHRILSLGAALDYSIANQIVDKRNMIKPEIDEMVNDLKRFYSKRDRDTKTRILPRIQNYK